MSANRTPSRQPAGVPTGGQFAPDTKARADLSLDDTPAGTLLGADVADYGEPVVIGAPDLREGDIYLTRYRDEQIPTRIVSGPTPERDRFDREMLAFQAQRLDTGETGKVVFGPSGVVDLVRSPSRQADGQPLAEVAAAPEGLHPELAGYAVGAGPELRQALTDASAAVKANDFETALNTLAIFAASDTVTQDQRLDAAHAAHRVAELRGFTAVVDGKTSFVAAMKDIKRTKPARPTIVWRADGKKKQDDLPDIEVPEGTVLTIRTETGLPFLKVRSGKVVFQAHSSWGNSITVHGGQVHISTDRVGARGLGGARKVSVRVEPPADSAVEREWDPGTEPPVVTCSPGEQWEADGGGRGAVSGSRLHYSDVRHRDLPFEARPNLDEVEVDRFGVPQGW